MIVLLALAACNPPPVDAYCGGLPVVTVLTASSDRPLTDGATISGTVTPWEDLAIHSVTVGGVAATATASTWVAVRSVSSRCRPARLILTACVAAFGSSAPRPKTAAAAVSTPTSRHAAANPVARTIR